MIIKKIFLYFFLISILLFKIPNFYIFPLYQNVFFTSQAVARLLLCLVFLFVIIEGSINKKRLFTDKKQKQTTLLIIFFFVLTTLSILSASNIISFLAHYKEIIIGLISYIIFYYYGREYKNIINIFIISICINVFYEFILLVQNVKAIDLLSQIIYKRHWEIVFSKLIKGRIYTETFDEIIIPFLTIPNNRSLKAWRILLIFFTSFFSLLSNIRTRIIMLAIALGGSLVSVARINWKKAIALATMFIVVSYVVDFIGLDLNRFTYVDRLAFKDEQEDINTITSRTEQIKESLVMGKASFFGVGLGNYFDNLSQNQKYRLYYKKDPNNISASKYVHSMFAQITAETGYITLLLFFLIIGTSFSHDWLLFKNGDPYQKAAVISFWTLFSYGLFNPNITGSYQVLFWGIRGLLTSNVGHKQ